MNDYKLLLSRIKEKLKPVGFRKSGDTFLISLGNNTGMIDFQKSQTSNPNSMKFTISLGVYSGALKVFDNFDVSSKPSILGCHWRVRLGFLLPAKEDYWWELTAGNMHVIEEDIYSALSQIGIPEIKKHLSDENLEAYWLQGKSDGLTEQQMYLYLIALLKANNKTQQLTDKVKELIQFATNKPFFNNVKEYLLKLGINDS